MIVPISGQYLPISVLRRVYLFYTMFFSINIKYERVTTNSLYTCNDRYSKTLRAQTLEYDQLLSGSGQLLTGLVGRQPVTLLHCRTIVQHETGAPNCATEAVMGGGGGGGR